MFQRFLSGCAIAGCLGLAQPTIVQAQTTEANAAEADEAAREHFLLGDRYYSEGDYERSVEEFQRAYDLSQRPALHYNLANAYERLGRYEEALRSLTLYAPHATQGRKAVVEKRIKALRARVHPTDPEQEATIPPPGGVETAAVGDPSADAEEDTTPYLGYGLLGLGAIGLGTGLYFALDASAARGDAEDACPSSAGGRFCTVDAREFLDRDQRSSVLADVGFGVGLVSALIGVYLVLDAADPATTPAPAARSGAGARGRAKISWPQPRLHLGPGRGEVTLVGRF